MPVFHFAPFDTHFDGPSAKRRGPAYGLIALISLWASGALLFVGFGMGFNPGWANEWPTGWPIAEVFPAGLTAMLGAILLVGDVGLGALLALLAKGWGRSRPYAERVFVAWVVVGALLALLACSAFYQSVHAEALAAFPNGYHP